MARKKRNKRIKQTGRFFMVRHEMFESQAFRSLDCTARCLLFELQRHYIPGVVEDVFLSVRDAARRLRVNKDTARAAFKTLTDRGFIDLTNHELWQARISRKWRLTFESYNGREPTNEWLRYKNLGPDRGDRLTQSRGQTAIHDAAKVEK